MLKALLAILNSTLLGFIINKTGDKSNQKLFPRISMNTIQHIPVKLPKNLTSLVGLVDSVIMKKSQNMDASVLEEQIDVMVYRIYKLTYEEVKFIDPEFILAKDEYDNTKIE